jgi:cobalamin biosynthesis Mg chelatase CobN
MATDKETQTQSTSASSSTHHHHHHHHSSSSSSSSSSEKKRRKHREDDSDRFKRQSLSAIKRKKFIEKWLFIILEVLAVICVLALIYVFLNT